MDVISFVDGLVFRAKCKGEVERFEFTPMPMFGLENYLREFGVLVGGRKLHRNGNRSFLVSKKQAEWAEQLCFRENYPKLGTLYPKNERYRGAGRPKRQWEAKGRKGGAIFSIGKAVNDIFKFFG